MHGDLNGLTHTNIITRSMNSFTHHTIKYAYMEMFEAVVPAASCNHYHQSERTHTCTRQSKYPLAVLFCSERPLKEMTFWLYYYIIVHTHTHTHAHTVCFCLSQPNKPMHKSIQFDYFNAVYILLTNQTFLSYDNFLIQSSKHTQMQLYECVAPPAPHPRSRVQYVLTSLFPDIPLTYTFNTIFAISYVSFRI